MEVEVLKEKSSWKEALERMSPEGQEFAKQLFRLQKQVARERAQKAKRGSVVFR